MTVQRMAPFVGARAWLRYDDGVAVVRFVDAAAEKVWVSWLPDVRDNERTDEQCLAVVSGALRFDRLVFDRFPDGSGFAAVRSAGLLRFMVRLEHARPSRFGEPAREGLVWTVAPYTGRAADGRLLGNFIPTSHSSRSRALNHARRLAGARTKGTPS